MTQPAQRTTFGRKGVVDPPIDVAKSWSLAQPSRRIGAQQDWNVGQPGSGRVPQRGRAWFFDRVFLWLPGAQAPGFPAIGLVLVRQALLPLVVMLVPFLVVGLVMGQLHMTSFNPGAPTYAAPSWLLSGAMPLLFASINLVQELNRYAFVRDAERPVRAVSIFAGVTMAGALLLIHHSLITMLGVIVIQVMASALIIVALNHRRPIAVVLMALMAGHTACDVMLMKMSQPAHSAPTAHKPEAIDPVPASLQSWAKLYPGAVADRASTMAMLGIVNWSARYTVKASPDQIGAFYQDLATRRGFTETRVILGQHQFKTPGPSNISGFRYTVFPTSQGSMVDFLAQGNAPTQ